MAWKRSSRILRGVGLVKDRRDGLLVHYSLNEKPLNQYASPLLELLKDWVNDDESIIKDLEELSKAVKLGRVSSRCIIS